MSNAKEPGTINTHVSFSRPNTTVPASTEVRLSQPSPITGLANYIMLHFPNGCNALVEVSCYVQGNKVLPDPDSPFIALNDTTQDFPVFAKVSRSDSLLVVIANRDSLNPHTPSVIWGLEGKR